MEFLQKTFRSTILLLTSLLVLAFAQNGHSQCSFNDLTWQVEDCVDGTFYVTFSFNNPLPSEDGFSVWKDFPAGYFVGLQSYGASSYTVGPFAGDGTTFYQFTLYDYSTNNCEGTISIGTVECDTSEECSLFASAQQSDCFGGGQFQWMFYVNPINNAVDNGYTIYNAFNQEVYSTESYGNNFSSIEAISNGVGETVTFTVVDNANPNCQQTITAVDLGCSLCEIDITSATVTECNAEGEYFVELSVSSTNSTTGQFTVGASYNFGVQWGPFDYGQESYTIGPIVSLGNENSINVSDVDTNTEGCYDSFYLGEIDCEGLCELGIADYTVDFFSEDNPGEFAVIATFENFNSTQIVDIYADGEFLFSHPMTGVTIYPIQGDCENPVTITFISQTTASCETSITVQPEVYCPSTECLLTTEILGVSDCNDTGEYYVFASVEVENPEAATFTVSAFGQMYGPYEYGQALYEIGPIIGDFGDIYPMQFQDIEDLECSAFVEVEPPFCINSCILDITSVTAGPCDDGDFYIDVAISAENNTSDVFNLVIGNQMFDGIPFNDQGTYSFAPINSNNTGIYQVAIYDPADDSCNDSFEIEVECEEVVNTCNLDITSVTTTECTTGEFFAELTIDTESTSTDVFNILIGVDVFSGQVYGQGTYTVGPISENSSGSYIASVNDPTDDSCYDSFTFEVECTPICSLFPSNFAPVNCDGDQVYFIGSIEAEDVGNGGFTVLVNGESYGVYEYEATTNYEFGPFPYLVGEDYNFEFIDNETDGACTGTYTYPAFGLENCENYCFVNLDAIEVSECNADNQYFLNFEVSTNAGSPSTSFMAIVGSTGEEFGPFNYGQDVYTAGPFTPDGTTGDFLYVQDASGVEGCGAHELLFTAPDCGLNFDCAIEITDLEVGECDANGEYMVNFQVNSENPASASFRVYINDDSWSYQFTYAGADIYSIGPFDSNISVINLLIHDTLDEGCSDFVSFATPDCNQVECGFDNLSLDYQGCNEETGTAFLVNFTPVGIGNTSFDVTANGEFLSTHLYADMPVTINIPAQPGNFALLNFCDNTNPNCCTEAFADVVNCDETGACSLWMNGAQFTDCVDGSFNIFVPTINMDGVLSETFNAYINDELIGNFSYDEEDWLFGPVTLDGETPLVLTIIDSENETCPASLNFGTPNPCENTPACTIDVPAFELSDCDEEGLIYVDFEITGLNEGDQFTVSGNGQEYGTFTYGETFYTVGPFEANGSVYELIFNSLAQDNCITLIGFETLGECNECTIDITFTEYQECNDAAQYYVTFGVVGLEEGDEFSAFGLGEDYGTFIFGEDSYTVGPFNGDGSGYSLVVSDLSQDQCFSTVSLSGQNCLDNFPCGFENISTQFEECAPNGAHFYTIDFEPINVTNNLFNYTVNGNTNLYAYDALPLDIIIFPTDEETATITICDNDNPECCQDILIELPECEEPLDCEPTELSLELTSCEEELGTGYILDFVPSEDAGESFTINTETELLGTYNYADLPVTIYVPGVEGNTAFLYFCDTENEECCFEEDVDVLNCDVECSVEILNAEVTECDEEGQFFIEFMIDVTGPLGTTFDVTVNGENYGTTSPSQTFFSAGPLDSNINDIWELIILGTDTDCSAIYTVLSPECSNEECSIEVSEYTLTDCDEIGNFYVNFSLEASNTLSEVFYAFHNGTNYGPFEFGQDSYQIGPLDGLETAVFEIDILVENNPDCFAQIVFDSANCGDNENCSLDIPEFELIDCDPDNQFYVQFAVVANSPDAASFVVTGNGENYGTFNYEDGSYIVGPFDGNLDPVWELIITDTENAECSTFITFVSAGCNEEECNLEVADYFTTECNDEGQYFVNIYLTETSFGSTFQIFNDDESYGPFEYGQEEYTVGPFNSGSDNFNLELFDTNLNQCFENIDVEGVDCPISDCFISDLEVATGECNAENTYSITINFVYDDIGGEFFNLIYQDDVIGTYETASLPITIENFDGNAEVETLTVCMTDLEDCCMSIDFMTPMCEGLVTWPGDGNFDGITNNMDILNMGVAYGFTGPERATDNVNWDAQDALAWQNNFISGVNYVHADADGSGEVNMADSEVVGVNYDLTHDEVTPFVELEPNDESPALFVDMPDPFELQQGMQFTAPIIFGLENLPVDNVYGVAFTLRYDPEIIDPSSISLEYPISWLGFPQTNLMTFDYHDIDLGEIDVAITKIDQNNVAGWGEILNFIGIIDNIAGKTEIFIEVNSVKAILSDEERFAVNTPTEITTITSTENVNELQGFELFPNPTNDIVRIKNETGLSLQTIQISDLNGKVLQTVKGENAFDLSNLPSGVYMAKVEFEGKTIYRRIVRM